MENIVAKKRSAIVTLYKICFSLIDFIDKQGSKVASEKVQNDKTI